MKSPAAIVLCALTFLVLPLFAYAEVTPTTVAQVLSATVMPAIPKAHEEVSIDVENYSYDLNAALITWSVNGRKQSEGRGQTHFVFTTGNLGETSTIKVTISPQGAATFSKEFTFTPSEISLIWEAQTYTPPFYKGKSLFADEAEATVVAMPKFIQNGKTISKENLIYTWKLGGDVLQGKSGYGKYFMTFTGGYFGGAEQIDVAVSSVDGAVHGTGSVTINPTQTQVLVYQNHPLYGLLTNSAIGDSAQLQNKEISLVAVPFFFSRFFGNAPDVTIDWQMNGTTAQSGDNGNTITLRQAGAPGTSILDVSVRHKAKTFQQTEKQFSISYN
jgi:hypothetical protein